MMRECSFQSFFSKTGGESSNWNGGGGERNVGMWNNLTGISGGSFALGKYMWKRQLMLVSNLGQGGHWFRLSPQLPKIDNVTSLIYCTRIRCVYV